MQKDENDQERPVAMVSRSLTDTEKHYSPIEGEALALVWSVDRLKHLITGGTTIVRTDHKPLIYIFQGAATKAKLMRWSLLLQQYDLHVDYIEGKANILADFASRVPIQEWFGLLDDAAFDLTSHIPPTSLVCTAFEEWKREADRKLASKRCKICQRHSELGGAIICDRCARTWHFACISMTAVPNSYWYCVDCKKQIQEQNLRDLTYDEELLAYLQKNVIPEDSAAATRVQNAGRFLKW